PLLGSRHGDAGVRSLPVERHTWNSAGKLRSAALKGAVAICRIRLTKHCERKPAMKECRFGKRPAAENSPKQRMGRRERNPVDSEGRNVMAHVIVAISVL